MNNDTIVAIATPLGEGGLGVIRLSGPKAIFLADSIFNNSKKLTDQKSHTLHHGWIADEEKRIDEVVVSLFKNPHSYTGEDVVEISCHGSPAVLKTLVQLCQKRGARHANPGEFTQRAYLNGKLDLSQAEAVADLISAHSKKAQSLASYQLQGELSKRIKKIRDGLIQFVAKVEANLDFVEEDIPGLEKTKMSKELDDAMQSIERLLSTSLRGRVIKDGIRVVLMGKPNVGKSSLFNALLTQDRAIVTPAPGTTRDVLEERLEWDGIGILLTDTAGLRKTKNVAEKKGTERAQKVQAVSDVIILVVDASLPSVNGIEKMRDELKNQKMVVAINKIDIQNKKTASHLKKSFSYNPTVETSALKNKGLQQLKAAVLACVQNDSPEISETPVLTNQRHIHHLELALKNLKKASRAITGKETEEAISLDVKAALHDLGAITGESVTEDVLSSIFKQFCIGK